MIAFRSSTFRASTLIECVLLLAVLAGLFRLYQPLHEAAWRGDQRFAEEQVRLEIFYPPIDLGKPDKLLPALCQSVGGHLLEAARGRFCDDDEPLGNEALPKQLGAADNPGFAALSMREERVQEYFKQRLVALQKQRGPALLRAEKPENLPPEARQADEALADMKRRFTLSDDPHEEGPWVSLRCAYRQWSHAYGRSPTPPDAERAEVVFTLAALLDGVELKTIPPAVFKGKADGCAQPVTPADIEGIARGLQDVYGAENLPRVKAMRELAQWAAWRFALLAVLAWVFLLLGRLSNAPLRVLALALPLWAGAGLGFGLIPWGWLAAAAVSSLLCLRVPLAAQAEVAAGRQAPASVWVFPLAVLLMGLGFWLLIDQSLFFMEKKRFLALKHQTDVFAAFALMSCLPLAAPWLLGWAMGASRWLSSAQNARFAAVAVLLRYGFAAALVLGVVVLAGHNFALTSDWLKSWLILASAGVFLTRGEVGAKLLGELSWRQCGPGLARLLAVLLPLLLVAGIAVAGLVKTKDIGPLVVIVLAGSVLVGAFVFAALYARSMARIILALLSGWTAAAAWVGLAVGAMFIVGRFFSRWLPHIRERLESVVDPYSGRNDQMAVVGMFREKVPDGGFGFAQTPWCGYGDLERCHGLPEQLASDYTATALIGVLGQTPALVLLAAFGLSLVLLVRAHALAVQPAATAADRWRGYAGWLALLWVLVTLAQTAMTLFGNLGRLPLSGIPLPFVSYGTASLLVNAFFLGLVLNLRRQPAALPVPARPPLRVAVFAVLLPVALALQGVLYYWIGARAAHDNAEPSHHDKRLYAAAKSLEKAIMPHTGSEADWQGRCKASATAEAASSKEASQLDRLGRIIQYHLCEMAAPGFRYVFDAQSWAKQAGQGVRAGDFEDADAKRALQRLADGQTLNRLEWRGRSPNPGRFMRDENQFVAVPKYLFDRRDPWIAADGCVVWGGGDATVYLPTGRRRNGADRCEHLARQDSAAAKPALPGQSLEDPATASWSVPPSLAEMLAPLAPLRDPGDPLFDGLVGENRASDKDPQQGLDLRLTIDPNIQRIAQQVASCAVGKAAANVCQALGLEAYGKAYMENARARMVGIALIHIETGEIRALASDHTDCHAADFGFGGRPKDCPPAPYRAAVRPDALLNHALFSDRMPASTVKPIMALGFLADGMADVESLKTELAKSDSIRFLDRMFYYERSSGKIQASPKREELIRDTAAKLGWNLGCDSGGADCGRFDPLFGRPTARRRGDRPIGLEQLYGRFFVEPPEEGAADMRLMHDLSYDADKMKACAASEYKQCDGTLKRLVSTGYGQRDSRATAVGVAGMMARLALAERGQPAPWPHLVKGHILRRIDGTEYATAASTQDFDDGRKLNAALPPSLDPAQVKTVLDGLRQGHRIGTSAKAFETVFKDGKTEQEKQQNLARWRRLQIAGKTGTPSYPMDGYKVSDLRKACADDRKLDCHARPLKWYGGVFGPADQPFEYAIAVLGERNWKKDGGIDDPHEHGSNVSAEIAFQLVKRLLPMPAPEAVPAAAKPNAPAGQTAKPKPTSKPDKKTKT